MHSFRGACGLSRTALVLLFVVTVAGCLPSRWRRSHPSVAGSMEKVILIDPPTRSAAVAPRTPSEVVLAAYQAPSSPSESPAEPARESAQQPSSPASSPVAEDPDDLSSGEPIPAPTPASLSLEDLEAFAMTANPTLQRLQQEAAAEWAQTGYVSSLPDPSISSMFFGKSMNFVPDRQLAELQIMQMIPWLGRLSAESQRAHLEALAAETDYHAERLRIVGEVRATWFRLYVLGKQIETTEADKAQLQTLLQTANARVATGNAQPGDVLLATLELSSLEEQLLTYRQQIAAATAELNRLVGRDARTPVDLPTEITAELPDWDHDFLMQLAMESQPELAAARLRTAATRWGIEVARLRRRPDLTFGAGWMVMTADPADPMPDAGADSWTLGLTATIPLGHRKYNAMVSEATNQHYAAHASEEEIEVRLDALLYELWEQARSSQQTIELYETTILPQARQSFEADQQSLANNSVTFDRVVRGYRSLLNFELGYHRALGQLAITLARIRQATGADVW